MPPDEFNGGESEGDSDNSGTISSAPNLGSTKIVHRHLNIPNVPNLTSTSPLIHQIWEKFSLSVWLTPAMPLGSGILRWVLDGR